ncbi:MAG: HAD family hydrolase [Bacteroidales bacterium]|nr:HAD family hydrolase [Bacteroidales bacterium]
MIEAVFFDIDGTLLSFHTHQVSVGTIRAAARLRSHGIRLFLSTGRPQVLIPHMPIDFDGLVTMNGALVKVADQNVYTNPIPDTDCRAWVDFAQQNNLCTMIFTADGMLAAQLNEAGKMLRDQLDFPMPPVVDIEQFRGLEIYQIIALMPQQFDATVAKVLPHCRLPRWHNAFTDIVANGNNKAHGMDALCQHLGINRSRTVAFGDGANDIEMLEWAGIGVAMGNADPIVKQHADMITTDVDHEGIETAINKLLT